MTQFRNVIAFEQRESTGSADDYQVGAMVTSWITYVGASTRNPNTSDFYTNVVNSPTGKRPGVTYHKWLKMGVLIHKFGFDVANHYVKKTLAWLAKPYSTTVVDAYTDEEGKEHPSETVVITNEAHYKQGLRKNKTHCLVKITDANYGELSKLILSDLSNVYCEKYYFKHINPPYTDSEGTHGGEFYVAPTKED